MNFSVTVVNSDGVEGPYFMPPVPAGDNVPPTMADQGLGFDAAGLAEEGYTPPLNGTSETRLPIYAITAGYGGTHPLWT
jgi:hypothetical protein